MSLPRIVSREEWLAGRRELLVREKEQTRQRDLLNADRRRLPMVRIETDYRFEGESGPATLLDLFEGSRQLIVYHAMFAPDWERACPGCTACMDEISPALRTHLKARDTSYVMVSRAPYPKLAAYRAEFGWTFPWYSSFENSFNYDYHVTLDPAVAPVSGNYRTLEELAAVRPEQVPQGSAEISGFSCFLRDGDALFHTYSTFGRGTELTGDAYGLLDLTALGRQEDWEEPKGRGGDARGASPVF